MCPSRLEIVALRLLTQNSKDFTTFNADPKRCNCISARCASATNAVSTGIATLNDLNQPNC